MIGETVVRLRATTTEDRYGQTIQVWTDPGRLNIGGCALAPVTAGESTDQGRQGVVIGWTLYAPAGADILATDRIEARDRTFDVDGEPADWTDPYTGRPAGLEVALRTVEG